MDGIHWNKDCEDLLETLEPLLMTCAAHYLVHEKQTSSPPSRVSVSSTSTIFHNPKPLDPVTRFHVGNGALVQDLFWKANASSPKGWKESWGIMVSYRYDLNVLSENQRAYHGHHNATNATNTATKDYQIPVSHNIHPFLSS